MAQEPGSYRLILSGAACYFGVNLGYFKVAPEELRVPGFASVDKIWVVECEGGDDSAKDRVAKILGEGLCGMPVYLRVGAERADGFVQWLLQQPSVFDDRRLVEWRPPAERASVSAGSSLEHA